MITNSADVDPTWLTQTLRQAGVLGTASVIGIETEPVGNGLLAESIRFKLSYDSIEADAPMAVVGKFPATNPTSKATGAAYGLYRSELRFYQEVARTVQIRTPQTYAAQFDASNHDFTLLMEDLAPARSGNQLTGCSLQDCANAMREAAALHGPRWNDPSLEGKDWLQARELVNGQILAVLPAIGKGFLEQYGPLLDAQNVAVVERFLPLYAEVLADRSAPRTIQHGDYRLDNMLFDVNGVAGRMATVDWQTVSLGPGLADVAYFIAGSLSAAERRAHEHDLVEVYFDHLRRLGVTDYSWHACWRDYRRFTFLGLFTAITATAKVARTARSDELFVKMTNDHCQQIVDLDSFGMWN